MTTAQSHIEAHNKTMRRYRKAKALAERGATPGERAAARAAMDRIIPIKTMADDIALLKELGIAI